MNLETTLKERGYKNGDYAEMARVIQNIKDCMRSSPKWESISAEHREALEMISHKMGRIVAGDPSHSDHWHDIQGYAKLGEKYAVDQQ